ncbi:MAG: hypothetical protein ABIQ93_08670 [Saprospiraceae bacterium]
MSFRFYPSVFALLMLILLVACKQDYATRKQRELASGVRNDSIFLGMYFGMPRVDFYRRCLEMNQAGIVTNGDQNTSVLYVISGYRQAINMNFYPDFSQGKIYNMKVWFDYQTWAPWNKEYYAATLVPDALSILEKWFGPGFIKQRSPEGKPFWAKINGNREITLRIQDERLLRADVTDLSVTPPANPAIDSIPANPRPLWEQHKK